MEVREDRGQDDLCFLIHAYLFPALPQGGYQQLGSEGAWKNISLPLLPR